MSNTVYIPIGGPMSMYGFHYNTLDNMAEKMINSFRITNMTGVYVLGWESVFINKFKEITECEKMNLYCPHPGIIQSWRQLEKDKFNMLRNDINFINENELSFDEGKKYYYIAYQRMIEQIKNSNKDYVILLLGDLGNKTIQTKLSVINTNNIINLNNMIQGI